MNDQQQIRGRRAMTWLRQFPLARRLMDKVIPLGPSGGAKDADIVGTALVTLPPVPPNRTTYRAAA